SAIVFATSSSEYSFWSENRSKSGDLDSSRLSVLKCFLDDQNSRFGSLKGVNSSLVELLVPETRDNQSVGWAQEKENTDIRELNANN
ncbi:hypothetical protein Tco_0905249, partial [Tanacetum coccineum]